VSGAGRTLRFTTVLLAPPHDVFVALTEAVHLERWFCDRATSEPLAGGQLTLEWTRPGASVETYVGHWQVFDPPRACAYDGGHAGYPNGDAGRIAFALEPDGPGTRLHTTHAFPPDPAYEAIADRYHGAWTRALERLGHHLAPSG
jgi:uncharacterized protein YndB with AHSA1/START domain